MTVTYYSLSVSSTGGVSLTPPSSGLVRKLISVLEAVERLPVFSHDSPGSSLNLQVQSLAVRELDEHGEETVCVERPASFAAGGLGRCVQLSYAEDKTPTSLNTFLTLSLTFCFYSHHLPPSLPPSFHSLLPSLPFLWSGDPAQIASQTGAVSWRNRSAGFHRAEFEIRATCLSGGPGEVSQ